MTVKELREFLATQPDDRLVVTFGGPCNDPDAAHVGVEAMHVEHGRRWLSIGRCNGSLCTCRGEGVTSVVTIY